MEKSCIFVYIILIHRTELAFTSYKNQKLRKLTWFQQLILFPERFSRERSGINNFWSATKIKISFWVYRKTVFQKTCSIILLENLEKYVWNRRNHSNVTGSRSATLLNTTVIRQKSEPQNGVYLIHQTTQFIPPRYTEFVVFTILKVCPETI